MRRGRYSVSMICSRYRGVHAASAAAGLCYNNAKYTKTRSCTRSGHARSRCVFYTVYRYFYYFFLFAKLFQHEEYITKKYSLSVIVGHSYLHEYNINNARNSKYYINRDNILVIFRKKKTINSLFFPRGIVNQYVIYTFKSVRRVAVYLSGNIRIFVCEIQIVYLYLKLDLNAKICHTILLIILYIA